MHAYRYEVYLQRFHQLLGNVRRRVRDDGDVAILRVMRGGLLLQHVIRLLCADDSILRDEAEQVLRLVRMDVDAQLRLRATHDETRAERTETLAYAPRFEAFAGDHALGAVAVLGVARAARHHHFVTGMHRRCNHADLAGVEIVRDAFEQLDEALGARIDDICGAHFLEYVARAGQGAAHRFHCTREQHAKVDLLGIAGQALELAREVREHGQQRALARLRQRIARVRRTGRCRQRKVACPDPRQMSCAIAEPEQELREDRTGVAARTIEGRIGGADQQSSCMILRRAFDGREHGRQRHRHVRAGVTIRHREHVDLVDVVRLLEQPVDAGAQRIGELHAIERVDRRSCDGRSGAHWIGTRKRVPFQERIAPSPMISSMRRPFGRVSPSPPRWPFTNTKRFAGTASKTCRLRFASGIC